MRKMYKRILSKIMIFVMCVGLLEGISIENVQAASSTGKVPMVCYTLSTGRVNTYEYSKGKYNDDKYSYTGYIDGSTDKCTILAVNKNGYCKVKYPVRNGTRTAYALSREFFVNTSFDTNETQIGVRKTVYRRSNLSQSLGTVYANDNVIIVGTSRNTTQIIYPAGSYYKLGWIEGTYGNSNNCSVKNGYYQIKSALDQNYVLDVYGESCEDGANIQLYYNKWATNQGFLIKKESDGYYSISAIHSGKRLDVAGSGKQNETNVLQWSAHNGDNQRWKIVKTSDGYYSFVSKCNGLYLDASGGRAANENNIQCYEGNGSKAQKFILAEVTVGGTTYNESNSASQNKTTFQLPLDNARCSWRSSNNWSWGENANGGGYSTSRVYHLGMDLLGSSDNVYATADGTVAKSGWNNANGNYVVIKHQLSGKTIYSFYAHMDSRCVSEGMAVSKGQKIGIVGNTGSSSRGKHLHFAMMDTLWNGSYYGYSTYFSGNSRNYREVTYYNPMYVIQNGNIP